MMLNSKTFNLQFDLNWLSDYSHLINGNNCYLSGQDTEEDEDEHPLEGVGDGEQIRSEGGLMEDVQHS